MNIISLPFEVLRDMPPGSVVYANYLDENADEKPMLCIKDYKPYIDNLPYRVPVELRMGLFEIKDVLLIPLLVCLNRDHQYMYETWINIKTSEGIKFLQTLSESSEIMLSFYDENTKSTRHKRTAHDATQIKRIMQHAIPKKSWMLDEFDDAREEIYEQYPTPHELWDALNRGE